MFICELLLKNMRERHRKTREESAQLKVNADEIIASAKQLMRELRSTLAERYPERVVIPDLKKEDQSKGTATSPNTPSATSRVSSADPCSFLQ